MICLMKNLGTTFLTVIYMVFVFVISALLIVEAS